ncbi:hypothetical protein AX17_003078 [Amanita inopinata Kibby_2008]|nr:hypothetical protein AX17_003078 [Amanita inopinata Kibby_2008]
MLKLNLFKQQPERCLYVAYYSRTPSTIYPVRYHTALVVLPVTDAETETKPEAETPLTQPSFPSSSSNTATIFHVVNAPVNENGRGRVTWNFKVEKADTRMAETSLRMRLVCLMHLATLSSSTSDAKLEKLLKRIDGNKYADEHPNWYCNNWTQEALQLLVEEKIIDPLPCSPEELWERGAHYARNGRDDNDIHVLPKQMAIPCCDQMGKELPSPMGPAKDEQ